MPLRAAEIARNQRTRTFELRAAFSLARLYQVTGRASYELLASAVPISLKDPVFLRLPKPPFARIAWTRRQPLFACTSGCTARAFSSVRTNLGNRTRDPRRELPCRRPSTLIQFVLTGRQETYQVYMHPSAGAGDSAIAITFAAPDYGLLLVSARGGSGGV
jgi:hypothetical protein